ncbi:MAG: ABC transporter substrate-binding protein [Myxococcota bacterium]
MIVSASMRLSVPLLLAATLLAISCGGSSRPGTDVLVIAIESGPSTLDPRLASDAYSSRLSALISNGLMSQDRNGRLVPDLAERVETPDPRTFIFHLRDNVRFQNGAPFTSADVAFTIASILDEKTRSPRRGDFKRIERVETPDPRTVVIRLKTPHAPFLTAAATGIVPENLGGLTPEAFGRAPIGTGPYRVAAWETNSSVTLEANADYYGERPRIPRAVFKIVPNDTTRILELRKGSVDLVQNAIPAHAVQLLADDPGIRVVTRPGINFSYLGFNLEDPVLAHRAVRAAIAHAIDRRAIVKHVLEGQASLAKELLAPSNWAYTDDVETYAYDPDRARALLDEAGFPAKEGGVRLNLTYKTSTNKERVHIAEAIVQFLKEVGIKTHLRSLEFGTLYADVKDGNFQMYSLTWVGITDPDILHYAFHSESVPDNGANRGRYRNARVDSLLEKARAVPEERARKKLYADALRILAHDLPYVPLWYATDIAAMRERVRDYEPWLGGDFRGILTATIEQRPEGP